VRHVSRVPRTLPVGHVPQLVCLSFWVTGNLIQRGAPPTIQTLEWSGAISGVLRLRRAAVAQLHGSNDHSTLTDVYVSPGPPAVFQAYLVADLALYIVLVAVGAVGALFRKHTVVSVFNVGLTVHILSVLVMGPTFVYILRCFSDIALLIASTSLSRSLVRAFLLVCLAWCG
jgi:hypothetical protein